MKWLWTPVFFLAAAFGQTQEPVTREGAYWVQTARGSAPVGEARRLRITTGGSITVRGESTGRITYELKKRFRADSEAEAARALGALKLESRSYGDWIRLTVRHPERSGVASDLAVTAPRSLVQAILETESGGIEIRDFDGGVEAQSGGGRIEADRIGEGFSATTGGGEIRLGVVNGTVRCLSAGGAIRVGRAGGESWFETAGGGITVGEAGGPVHASTAGGNIDIERAAAAVSARTAGGGIEVREAGGQVTAETAGGSIQIGAAKGVRCESAAGTIRLRDVSGSLRASTAVGSVVAEVVAGGSLGDSFLNTGSGDVTVYIPSNVAVTVRAQSASAGRMARIVSEFPEIRVVPPDAPGLRASIAEGTLNGGGPLLRISASGGTVYLRRR